MGPVRRSPITALNHPLANYYLILTATLTLLTVGLVMVLSASSVVAYKTTGSSLSYFNRQLLGVGIGLPVLFVASRLNMRAIRGLAYPALLVAVLGLVAVLIPGVGTGGYGAVRWINVGPLLFQPSEVAKLSLVVWGADLLARKHRLLGDTKHLLLPLVPVTVAFCGLIMLEPDLGTTLVILAILMALLNQAGASVKMFSAIGAAVAAVVTILAVTEPYRLARLMSFRHPFDDASGNGYQVVHGLYALASGGWTGVGLGASREKWGFLPNAHTDFILAIIGEELGFIGCVGVIGLFIMFSLTGLRIARRSSNRFVQLSAVAIVAWLAGQAFVNMGAVVGLLPVTGIPLPLISYGGSAMIPNLAAIGLLTAFARQEPEARTYLADRKAARKEGRV